MNHRITALLAIALATRDAQAQAPESGDVRPVMVRIEDGEKRVVGDVLTVRMTDPQGTSRSAELRDDGSPPDTAPADHQWTAILQDLRGDTFTVSLESAAGLIGQGSAEFTGGGERDLVVRVLTRGIEVGSRRDATPSPNPVAPGGAAAPENGRSLWLGAVLGLLVGALAMRWIGGTDRLRALSVPPWRDVRPFGDHLPGTLDAPSWWRADDRDQLLRTLAEGLTGAGLVVVVCPDQRRAWWTAAAPTAWVYSHAPAHSGALRRNARTLRALGGRLVLLIDGAEALAGAPTEILAVGCPVFIAPTGDAPPPAGFVSADLRQPVASREVG